MSAFSATRIFLTGSPLISEMKKRLSRLLELLGRGCGLDAAREPTAAREDLRLEHDRVADLSGYMNRLLHGGGNAAPRHGDAHRLKDIGGFEFVESHSDPGIPCMSILYGWIGQV